MYATDTRIGCRLSLLRYHAAGEGASLFPVGAGEALRCSPGGPRKRRCAIFRSLGFMVLQ